ncbi:hypothetical protein V6B08_14515 [Ferrovibrio sp. MS7]|uniref:hypothetical protein n=1 Tax=Ferrovibrio plantarum TaxID=3119164 RepID=UPI0031371470
MRGHLLAAGFLLAALAAWGFSLSATLTEADLPDSAEGRLLAVFPLRHGGQQSFAAASRAGGAIARELWLPNMLVVEDRSPGFAERLRQAGAVAVYRAEPFEAFTLSGCTGMPPKPLSFRRFG